MIGVFRVSYGLRKGEKDEAGVYARLVKLGYGGFLMNDHY